MLLRFFVSKQINMELQAETLKKSLLHQLTGNRSHQKMAPASRIDDVEIAKSKGDFANARKSAVMILMYNEANRTKVIFIRRSFYVGIHAGQIAFPGGRFEIEDITLENTALREIEEEIGIKSNEINVLGRLSDIFVPASNFIISVFIGFLQQKPNYSPDHREVAEIIEIDLSEFFEHDVIREKVFLVPSATQSIMAPYYKVGNIELWGASAMVMSELIDMIRYEE